MENEAAVTPLISRPTNSQIRLGASAMNTKSQPSPKMENSSTGRRPKRSDRAPWIGENTNCIRAKAAPNRP